MTDKVNAAPAGSVVIMKLPNNKVAIFSPGNPEEPTVIRADATVEIGTTVVEILEGKKIAPPVSYRSSQGVTVPSMTERSKPDFVPKANPANERIRLISSNTSESEGGEE